MGWSVTPRHPGKYFQKRSYEVEPRGKKFATIHRVDGYWTGTLLSKSKKQAIRKGEDHLNNYVNY